MTMSKTKKSIISFICVILALCTGLLGAMQIFAESQQDVQYLSDIKLFYSGSGLDDAKKKSETQGYTLLPNDLNKGTAQNYVYLGYKTTTNRDLAITDIRMLGMGREYYLYDYKQIVDYMKKSNEGTAQTMLEASKKLAANYKAGSPKAKDACEGLNLFYVGNENTKLGDYIVAGKADINLFAKMIVKSSSGTISAVMSFLNTGIAPFENAQEINEQNEQLRQNMAVIAKENEETTKAAAEEPEAADGETDENANGQTEETTADENTDEATDASTETTTEATTETVTESAEETTTEAVTEPATQAPAQTADENETLTWADALDENPLWDVINNSDITTAEKSVLHKQYNDEARAIFSQIQDFTTCYENAIGRNPDYNGGSLKKINSVDNNISLDKAVDEMESLEIEDGDALYLAAFETLNQYNVDEDTKLGDWIIDMGLQNSEEVDIMQLYPLIDTMGKEQSGLAGIVGFLGAASNLGENQQSKDMALNIDEVRNDIKQYNKKDCISVFESSDEDIDDAHLAYTSDAVRKSGANNSIGKKTYEEIFDEKFNEWMEKINLIASICFVATFVVQTAFAIASVALATSASCAFASAVCSACAAGIGLCTTGLFWVGIGILIVSLAYMAATWLMDQFEKLFPTVKHTTMPDYVYDVADTKDGYVTVKYKSVKDMNDNIGDLNGYRQEKWALLAYTTDTSVGSPVRADSSGEIFKVMYGNSAVQGGYDCVNFFGERSPANANYQTGYDKVSGIYISYRTEDSIKNAAPPSTTETDENGKPVQQTETVDTTSYISDIIVATAGNAGDAKAKITKKSGKYYLIDYNLSPGAPQATYIGYSMTTNKDEAITDIRIAPYHGNDALIFGEVQYTFVGHLGVDVGNDSNQTQGDALMKTTDPKAGSPIPADGIHMVTNHKDAELGWEPVTLFCGMPYNFNTNYEQLDKSIGSGYYTTNSNRWDRKSVYMYYEPSVKYIGGERYLSGIYFYNGYNTSKTAEMLWSQTKSNLNQLRDKLNEYPNVTIDDVDLASSMSIGLDTGHSNLRQYLCYTYTYNPKRAINDIVIYQGDTYSDTLPYSISKKNGETKSDISYAACSVACQQAPNLYDIREMKVTRFISPSNAVYNSKALLELDYDYDAELMSGYTYSLPEGFNFGYKMSNFIPLGLYVSCNATGKEPLKLSDVIISDGWHEGVEENGKITFDVSNEETLVGTQAQGAFHAVYDIKNPNSLNPISIAYPEWYNSKNSRKAPVFTYIYIRGAKEAKGKYISSVTVGSFSRDLYKKATATGNQGGQSAGNGEIDAAVNGTAMLGAAGTCTDEMIGINLGCKQGDAWYNRQKNGKALNSAPVDTPASYIGVSRTDKPSDAIRGILLYQNDDYPTANTIEIDGASYYCDSTNAPIIMNGKQYYLYYTRNRGVLSGLPIEEISVDSIPMIEGYFTALSAKKGESTTYGEGDLPYYIHLYSKSYSGSFLTEVYIGKGSNKQAALGNLVQQECPKYIDMDMNYLACGDSIYLGYSTGYLDPDATEKERQDALNEAIYDIIVTKGEPYQPDGFISENNNIYYKPVSDVNLNEVRGSGGHNNGKPDELYMYYCSQYTSERYNRTQKKAKTGIVTALPNAVFSAPLSKIAFANYDRVPYNSELPSTSSTGNEMMKWEYIMLSDHSKQVDFTEGTVSYTGEFINDNRVTMFAQRLDGSVKPAGEITGGFVAEQMRVGTLELD